MEPLPLYEKSLPDDKFLNALAHAYRLQEAIISTTELAVISTDIHGTITSFNQAAELLLGYSADNVIDRVSILAFHEAQEILHRATILSDELNKTIAPGFDVFIARVQEKKNAERCEWTYVRKDGIMFPVSISVTALWDEKNDRIGYAFIATDISMQKRVEEEFRQVSDENERVFNYTINLNVITGFDGYFKKLSPAWTDRLGWTMEELKARPLTDFIHGDDIGPTQEALRFIRGGNNLHTFENRYRCKDGSYRWLLWSSSADVDRQLIFASAIDITDRKKSEDELIRSKNHLEVVASELQEQNRALDEFAHIISHNLRSPIGNIKALIGLLNEQSSIDEYKMIFEKLKNVAGNLSETMNELMETLKVKKNTEIEYTDIRFKDMLDKVIQSLEGELIQSEATVTFDFNQVPTIGYSKTYLESIFQNLLTNAVKYRSPDRKPEIHVSSGIVDGKTELRVRDNGLGIDMQKFGHKLFGLHKTFHENKEARGVGLFLTKTQIEAMGGSVIAESEVNKGTTFIIRF
ncbi:sensor histidine kinase [Parachryseolinea silvisoli]|uniref:sensor histidine kinase n=1 Tax=Parachryseolinea silvisoli TaxID=2873601 RepID=UPI0022658918|nr:PAS domain-containing sensor histidine kinase [Parachryseolinea silvisoli]MCD9014252.1 PAS domain-containing sensor histidine kinase [Parachryseolinea silvisoli]